MVGHELAKQVPPGVGYGLGFQVLMNVGQRQIMGSEGEYSWRGAASGSFDKTIAILEKSGIMAGTVPTI